MCRHGVGLYVLKMLFWPSYMKAKGSLLGDCWEVFIDEVERNNIDRSFLPPTLVQRFSMLSHSDNVNPKVMDKPH